MPVKRPAYQGRKFCDGAAPAGSLPSRILVWPTNQARRRTIVLDSPGASWNGTNKVAPGLKVPCVGVGASKQAPLATSRQAMVNGSNQPPRNQVWFTLTAGSETVTENAPSSQGRSAGLPHH